MEEASISLTASTLGKSFNPIEVTPLIKWYCWSVSCLKVRVNQMFIWGAGHLQGSWLYNKWIKWCNCGIPHVHQGLTSNVWPWGWGSFLTSEMGFGFSKKKKNVLSEAWKACLLLSAEFTHLKRQGSF